MGAYAQAVEKRDELREELSRLQEDYERRRTELERGIREADELIAAAEGGADADALETARRMLQASWDWKLSDGRRNITSEVREVIRDAAEDARAGFPKLRDRFFAVKSYARWTSQREDCPYGMRPAYGQVWFRLGLSAEYLAELRGREASDVERRAAAAAIGQMLDDVHVADVLIGG